MLVVTVMVDRTIVIDGSTGFREDFYRCLTARPDALFEVAEAVLCVDRPVKSLARCGSDRRVDLPRREVDLSSQGDCSRRRAAQERRSWWLRRHLQGTADTMKVTGVFGHTWP